MPEPDLIQLFVQPLNQLGVRYLMSGSVAAMLYGEPRVTHDIDLVVFLRSEQVVRLREVYPPLEFYVPPAEVICDRNGAGKARHFNVIHADSGLKADFYTANRGELHARAFRRQTNIPSVTRAFRSLRRNT